MDTQYDAFEALLTLALREDLQDNGDVTSRAIFDKQTGTARLVAKQAGILAGIEFFSRVFSRVDQRIDVEIHIEDGVMLKEGDCVASVTGPVVSILEAERTAINFLSFLSGIATETRSFVEAVQGGNSVILDTRKTLPGYRVLSKYAVAVGGAQNHRMGLHDMVMIKDNHIDAAGSIKAAVEKVRERWGDQFRVEVEVRDLEETRQALEVGVDVIMLDNMDEKTTAQAVNLGKGAVLFESSGNMDLEKVKSYVPTGVDFISVGKLTHSVQAFDFSLRMEERG